MKVQDDGTVLPSRAATADELAVLPKAGVKQQVPSDLTVPAQDASVSLTGDQIPSGWTKAQTADASADVSADGVERADAPKVQADGTAREYSFTGSLWAY